MSTIRKPGNFKITAPKQVALLKDEIARRESDLLSLEDKISVEKKRIQLDALALNVLTVKLEFSERSLAAHKCDLADLRDYKEQLEHLGHESSEDNDDIIGQIHRQDDKITTLSHTIEEMVETLNAEQLVHIISKSHFEVMKEHREGILGMLGRLRVALSPIHDVPAEVWAIVFRFCLEENIKAYLKDRISTKICHTPFILSHVCALWRRVVHMQRDLWNYFICQTGDIRRASDLERWKCHTDFQPPSLTYIASIDDRLGTTSSPSKVNTGKASYYPHGVHILGFCSYLAKVARALPFRGQKSVGLQLDHWDIASIEEIHPLFDSCTSLTIISSPPLPQLQGTISGRTVPITILELNLTTFNSFRIDKFAGTKHLEELHLIHNGINHLTSKAVGARYEKLQILGITPPDIVWMENFRFSCLQHLILYGPKLKTVATPSLQTLSQHADFHGVKQLDLRNWPLYKPTSGVTWTITPLVLQIVGKLRFIETLRCADSLVDGESLVALVKSLKSKTPIQTPSKLKTVIIDCCTGITRQDCELIAASVEKLVVYV